MTKPRSERARAHISREPESQSNVWSPEAMSYRVWLRRQREDGIDPDPNAKKMMRVFLEAQRDLRDAREAQALGAQIDQGAIENQLVVINDAAESAEISDEQRHWEAEIDRALDQGIVNRFTLSRAATIVNRPTWEVFQKIVRTDRLTGDIYSKISEAEARVNEAYEREASRITEEQWILITHMMSVLQAQNAAELMVSPQQEDDVRRSEMFRLVNHPYVNQAGHASESVYMLAEIAKHGLPKISTSRAYGSSVAGGDVLKRRDVLTMLRRISKDEELSAAFFPTQVRPRQVDTFATTLYRNTATEALVVSNGAFYLGEPTPEMQYLRTMDREAIEVGLDTLRTKLPDILKERQNKELRRKKKFNDLLIERYRTYSVFSDTTTKIRHYHSGLFSGVSRFLSSAVKKEFTELSEQQTRLRDRYHVLNKELKTNYLDLLAGRDIAVLAEGAYLKLSDTPTGAGARRQLEDYKAKRLLEEQRGKYDDVGTDVGR